MPFQSGAPLFGAAELTHWLHYDVDEASCDQAELVVTGWIADALGADVVPDAEQGSPIYGWAIELGGIAYENPTSMVQETSGAESTSWSIVRRREILASVRAWGVRTTSTPRAGLARGSFPAAESWPDPVRRYW